MPGISLQYGDGGTESIGDRLASACHDARYERRVVVETESGVLGYTGYAEYPVTTCRVGDFTLAFEGHVYDWERESVAENLRRLVADRFDGFENRAAISRWVRTTDGEFVLVAMHRESGEVFLVGDCLGRLPLYYAESDGEVMLSREHRVVGDWVADVERGENSDGNDCSGRSGGSENTGRVADEDGQRPETDGGVALGSSEGRVEGRGTGGREPKEQTPIEVEGHELPVSIDRLALAQYLLFGHTLGSCTLVEGVTRLPAAPFVRVTGEGTTVERLDEFDFGTRAHRERSREENAARLARLFERACRRRAGLGAPGDDAEASSSLTATGRTPAEDAASAGSETSAASDTPVESDTSIESDTPATPGTSAGLGAPNGSRAPDESGGPNLIALDGGFGSRAVLAAFAEGDLPCLTATMDHPGVDWDVTSARELAACYEVPWKRYEIETPEGELLARHAGHTNASDPLGARKLSFLAELCDDHGPCTYFSDVGGDETLSSLVPPGGFDGAEDLLSRLVGREGRYTMSDAAALAGVSVETLEGSVRERLASYPETDPDGKYVRFQVDERTNGVFEAEDVDRRFLWNTTPFYSLPFFRYAMHCPDEQKRRHRLSEDFLVRLSARALDPMDADRPFPPGTVLHTAATRAAETLGRHPAVARTVKPLAKRVLGTRDSDADGALHECIRAQVGRSALARSVLSGETLDRVLSPGQGIDYSRQDVHLLLSVTAYLDRLAPGRSVLERRSDPAVE